MNDAIASNDIWNDNIGTIDCNPSIRDIHIHRISIESFDFTAGKTSAGSVPCDNMILENIS